TTNITSTAMSSPTPITLTITQSVITHDSGLYALCRAGRYRGGSGCRPAGRFRGLAAHGLFRRYPRPLSTARGGIGRVARGSSAARRDRQQLSVSGGVGRLTNAKVVGRRHFVGHLVTFDPRP